MGGRIDREELRQLIREALMEALGDPVAPSAPQPHEDQVRQEQARGGTRTLDVGVLTEAAVSAAGRMSARIVIGPEVAVTPLARDRAREMKVEIVRKPR